MNFFLKMIRRSLNPLEHLSSNVGRRIAIIIGKWTLVGLTSSYNRLSV